MKNFAAFLIMCLGVARSYAARPINLEGYYRSESGATPAISPDGRWVVFVRNSIIEAENQRHSEIWMRGADGSAPATRLSNATMNASAPRWSPDGKLLSFRQGRGRGAGAEGDVWVLRMDPTGCEPIQIAGVCGTPIFSPDNRWIAYTRKTPPDAKARDLTPFEKQLDQRFKGRMYDWMNIRFDQRGYLPDPRDPVASPPLELYIVAREGGSPKQLTQLGVDVKAAAWRPDGAGLALVADSHQRDEYSYERAGLWTIKIDGKRNSLTEAGFAKNFS